MDKLERLEKRTPIAHSEYVPMNSLLNQEGLVDRSRALRAMPFVLIYSMRTFRKTTHNLAASLIARP
jgi:hypothetical protein